jgi:hypothetical protein
VIDLEELSKAHYRNRVGNCWADREKWPCRRWEDAETINALTAEVARLTALTDPVAEGAILSRAEAYRLVEEARQMRAERDELAQAIAQLTGAFP